MEDASLFMATPTAVVRVDFSHTPFPPTQPVLPPPRCCGQNLELGPNLLCDLFLGLQLSFLMRTLLFKKS